MLLLCSDHERACLEPIAIGLDTPTDVDKAAQLVPLPQRRGCALLAASGVTVNGIPALPLQVLRDRDEIRVAGHSFYFTTDAIPEIVVLRSSKVIRCARCLDQFPEGGHVIRCPGCDAHHHPDCWSDGGGCQKCRHPANSLSWTPEPVR